MTSLTAEQRHNFRQIRPLYLVRARDIDRRAEEKITPAEALAGWRLTRDGSPGAINEGHCRGSLHSLTAPHLLTWDVTPGDQVLAVFAVTLSGQIVLEQGEAFVKWSRASTLRLIQPHLGVEVRVVCRTHPGHDAPLGGDGWEDAHDGDALADALDSALRGDWRPVWCAAEFVDSSDLEETTEDRVIAVYGGDA